MVSKPVSGQSVNSDRSLDTSAFPVTNPEELDGLPRLVKLSRR